MGVLTDVLRSNVALHSMANPEYLGLQSRWLWLSSVFFVVLMGAAITIRQRSPESRPLVHLTLQSLWINTAIFVYLIGPFTSPALIGVLGQWIIVYAFFDAFASILGITSFLTALALLTVAADQDLIPYAPLLEGIPLGSEQPTTAWIAVIGGVSISLFLVYTAVTAHLIHRLRKREAQLDRLSKTDGLTGVANQRHFMDLLELEFLRNERHLGKMSLMILDMDWFKRVNDEHGHLAGDSVLVAVAETLKQEVRINDIVARYGGEEFMVLLPETDTEGAYAVAERCREAIEVADFLRGASPVLKVSASIGVASYPSPGVLRTRDLIQRADEALYRAKDRGRNLVCT